MKKFIKSVSVCLTVIMILCCSLVVPAFAASGGEIVDADVCFEGYLTTSGFNSLDAENHYTSEYYLEPGSYVIVYGSLTDSPVVNSYSGNESIYGVCIASDDGSFLSDLNISSGSVLVISDDMIAVGSADCYVVVNSYLLEPVVSVYKAPVVDEPVVDLPASDVDILDNILGLWSDVIAWFGSAFANLVPVFYNAETGFTLIGYLAIGSIAVSAAFLFLCLLQKWLRFGR